MPIALALTGGFILAAISPTVMVTGMLELQRRGYGEAKSASHLVSASCTLLVLFRQSPPQADCPGRH